MVPPVKLSAVVTHLEMVGDEKAVYLNRRTGDLVVLLSDEDLGFEDEDDFAEASDGIEPDWLEEQDDWFKEQHALRRETMNSEDYISLPDKWDIHEWQIMDDFCVSLPAGNFRDQLRDSIRGEGAFRRFHSAIRRLQLEDTWYDFRTKAFTNIALTWLEENEVPFIHDVELYKPDHRKATTEQPGDGVEQKVVPAQSTTKRNRTIGSEDQIQPPHEIQAKLVDGQEIKVFISHRDSKCDECGEALGRQAWITLEEDKGALCLACADLDELVFLPTGDAALTRRSKKYSTLWAVVLKFSRARRRYERQGLLVEEEALAKAEMECLADAEIRERRNERARERRSELDEEYIKEFAKRIRELFPNCPKGREKKIAEHACMKYSGRVGRSASAKSFADEAVRLAVTAHVRHRETNYDALLAQGWFRNQARSTVRSKVEAVLEDWS